MKRSIKNIIMILIIIVMGVLSYFTMKDVQNTNNSITAQPQMPTQNQGGENSNMGEPPAKPYGEVEQREMQMMPGGNSNSSSSSVTKTGETTVDGTEQALNQSYTTDQSDESAILVQNGGNVTLNADNQTLEENIEIDNISTLKMNLTNSKYKGTINADNTAKEITLKLDSNSKITLTGDSYITALEDSDSTYSNIDFNGYKLYVNGTAIN